jgi:hypothetical protein
MQPKRKFAIEEPRVMGGQLGVNQSIVDFAEFRRELKRELEHGLKAPEVHDDAPITGKIAWAHLKGIPDSHTHWSNSMPKQTWSRQRKG